jgi:hypothetical protein
MLPISEFLGRVDTSGFDFPSICDRAAYIDTLIVYFPRCPRPLVGCLQDVTSGSVISNAPRDPLQRSFASV